MAWTECKLFCLDLVCNCFGLCRQKLYVCMVECISWLHSCLCVDVMVLSSAWVMTWTGALGGGHVCSVNVSSLFYYHLINFNLLFRYIFVHKIKIIIIIYICIFGGTVFIFQDVALMIKTYFPHSKNIYVLPEERWNIWILKSKNLSEILQYDFCFILRSFASSWGSYQIMRAELEVGITIMINYIYKLSYKPIEFNIYVSCHNCIFLFISVYGRGFTSWHLGLHPHPEPLRLTSEICGWYISSTRAVSGSVTNP